MKSRIWRLAGVGLLCVSVTAQSMADEPQNRGPDGGQRGRVAIRAIIRAVVAVTSRTRKIASSRISPVRKTTTIAEATTARINSGQ